ncbi:MAG: hypothetical protein IKY61_07740 [Thermoguttaceae bacterium]|nr:hypothetical protein [Thermoguttaceae bacterium]
MNEERKKAKKEIGVGGYLKRIFAFWGVVILFVALCLGVGEATIKPEAFANYLPLGLTHCALVATCLAVWLFPAFCVDVLKPRPVLATLASFFCALLALWTITTYGPKIDLKRGVICGWQERAVVWGVTLVYLLGLVAKLRNKNVCESTRRLSGAIFAATVVPTLLALLAWGALRVLDELDPALNAGTAGCFLVLTLFYFPVLTRPAIIALGASAAIYGVFALAVYRARRKTRGESETAETVENAEVEAAEND